MNTAFLQNADELDFWRDLSPNEPITEQKRENLECQPFEIRGGIQEEKQHKSEGMSRDLHLDGYIQIDDVFTKHEIHRLRSLVESVQERTGLAVFCFVYDLVWELYPKLALALREVLGSKPVILPNFWTWFLAPSPGESGWPPHRDRTGAKLREDGLSDVLTVWLALSEIGADNGCIYVLPACEDPYYQSSKGGIDPERLQDIRALPLHAGSVLAWTPQILHWGGHCSRHAAEPRISIGFELQRADTKKNYDYPPIEMSTIPSFSFRLALIARQLLQYQDMISLSPPLKKWCKKWNRLLPRRSFWEDFSQRFLRF